MKLPDVPEIEVTVRVPNLLRDCTNDHTRFTVSASTVEGAIEAMRSQYPLLRMHLYDEDDHLRRHILLYFNDENVAWLPRLDVPVKPGDELRVLQNVSGG